MADKVCFVSTVVVAQIAYVVPEKAYLKGDNLPPTDVLAEHSKCLQGDACAQYQRQQKGDAGNNGEQPPLCYDGEGESCHDEEIVEMQCPLVEVVACTMAPRTAEVASS